MNTFGSFAGKTLWQIAKENFELEDGDALADVLGAQLVFAIYTTESYEGSAFVLFERNGTLYEVNGSHCSCHGLERCWDPEEVTLEALVHRMEKGQLGCEWGGEVTFRNDLARALKNFFNN